MLRLSGLAGEARREQNTASQDESPAEELHAPGHEALRLGFRPGRLCSARGGPRRPTRSAAAFPISPRHHGLLLRRPPPCLRRLSLLHRAAQECDVNPEPFLQIDRVIHEKGRLAIMSMLAASPELSFTDLRGTLSMTDVKISTYIRTLQEAG